MVITFPSYTRAHVGLGALAQKGIEARIVRLGADARERGCAYGLMLTGPHPDPDGALSALRRAGVEYRAVRDHV